MMMKVALHILCMILLVAFGQSSEGKPLPPARSLDKASSFQRSDRDAEKEKAAVAETARVVAEVINASFPELQNASLKIKTFHSRSDYFRSRFSFSRFVTLRKLRCLILVNPTIFERGAPAKGVRAIVAHELAHVAYYYRHSRLELFGLVGLWSKSFAVRFERLADLQAIRRGYGAGLKEYRLWLYKNIPATKIADKERDYFSPEEIDLILKEIERKPDLINCWLKNVPRNPMEINACFAR